MGLGEHAQCTYFIRAARGCSEVTSGIRCAEIHQYYMLGAKGCRLSVRVWISPSCTANLSSLYLVLPRLVMCLCPPGGPYTNDIDIDIVTPYVGQSHGEHASVEAMGASMRYRITSPRFQ